MFSSSFHRVNWKTSSFLIGTLFLTLTVVPVYLWNFGLDWFQVAFFFVMFARTGSASRSATIGFSRIARFRRIGRCAFSRCSSARRLLRIRRSCGRSEHRRHHKHVDHEEDPYDISKGFFHAHIGWLLFKIEPDLPFDNVADLQKDKLVIWQHKYVQLIAVLVSFVMPAAVGWLWNGAAGALGAFLLAGVARVVGVQHSTFCINSLCHTVGKRPYSARCSARDSWIMAILTFGEGYHNYHHEFQHDYRNGVKPWQWDPTKWAIWTLSKLGLAGSLRRVPSERILLAQLGEAQRRLETKLSSSHLTEDARAYITCAYERLLATTRAWAQHKAGQLEVSREMLVELREEIRAALRSLNLRGFPRPESA